MNHNSLGCKQPYITQAYMLKLKVTQYILNLYIYMHEHLLVHTAICQVALQIYMYMYLYIYIYIYMRSPAVMYGHHVITNRPQM